MRYAQQQYRLTNRFDSQPMLFLVIRLVLLAVATLFCATVAA
jgi:hypothetical protein